MYYYQIYLSITASELYVFKKKVEFELYCEIFKYSDILISTKNIPGVFYSHIEEIFKALRETGTVVVTFDLNIDKSTQILKFFELFTLNRTTEIK